MVAPPGRSLHRLGTELDLGPASAYPWLMANAPRFHFIHRYAWEPWHFGLGLNPGSASLGYTADRRTSLPSFVPVAFAPVIARAAQRWNVVRRCSAPSCIRSPASIRSRDPPQG